VEEALPNNLGMGLEYWNPAGVNIPRLGGGGGWFNGGTNLADAIYAWNGLTIFDNGDSSGATNVNDPNYSTPLPALDALGAHEYFIRDAVHLPVAPIAATAYRT
jgi:hypothetical protein